MSTLLRIILLLCGISFTGIIFYLLVNRKITEKNSLVWLFSALSVLGITAFPQLLDRAAEIVGIDYPPSLIFLISALVLLFCILYYSMQISALEKKIRKLAQQIAIDEALEKKDKEE